MLVVVLDALRCCSHPRRLTQAGGACMARFVLVHFTPFTSRSFAACALSNITTASRPLSSPPRVPLHARHHPTPRPHALSCARPVRFQTLHPASLSSPPPAISCCMPLTTPRRACRMPGCHLQAVCALEHYKRRQQLLLHAALHALPLGSPLRLIAFCCTLKPLHFLAVSLLFDPAVHPPPCLHPRTQSQFVSAANRARCRHLLSLWCTFVSVAMLLRYLDCNAQLCAKLSSA